MMRLERELENYSGARLFADEPYAPSEPAHAELQISTPPPLAAQPVPAARAPVAANDDWSIPRPSRTGIAPAPASMPADHPRISLDEIREDVRPNTSRSATDLLAQSLRLAGRYRTGLVSALSELRDRIASLTTK